MAATIHNNENINTVGFLLDIELDDLEFVDITHDKLDKMKDEDEMILKIRFDFSHKSDKEYNGKVTEYVLLSKKEANRVLEEMSYVACDDFIIEDYVYAVYADRENVQHLIRLGVAIQGKDSSLIGQLFLDCINSDR